MPKVAGVTLGSLLDLNDSDEDRNQLSTKLSGLLDFGRSFQADLRVQQQLQQAAEGSGDKAAGWKASKPGSTSHPSANPTGFASGSGRGGVTADAIAQMFHFPTTFALRSDRTAKIDRLLKPLPDGVNWFPTDALCFRRN